MSHTTALSHTFLSASVFTLVACGGQSLPNSPQGSSTNFEALVASYPSYPLDEEALVGMAYLWNEEKLARDLYATLYALHNSNLSVLENVSSRSETQHVEAMTALLQKYNLSPYYPNEDPNGNTSYDAEVLAAIPSDVFVNQDITNLYNTLFTYGQNDAISALEVGCMIEVQDVADLNKDIAKAESLGADDLLDIYTRLRQGSYNHYWGFDNALINQGVIEGCGSLGEAYDKTSEEFPQQKG
jgi:hypothetical protein